MEPYFNNFFLGLGLFWSTIYVCISQSVEKRPPSGQEKMKKKGFLIPYSRIPISTSKLYHSMRPTLWRILRMDRLFTEAWRTSASLFCYTRFPPRRSEKLEEAGEPESCFKITSTHVFWCWSEEDSGLNKHTLRRISVLSFILKKWLVLCFIVHSNG